ncbi:phosphatase PAP2 family protein [Spirosoma arcticum]
MKDWQGGDFWQKKRIGRATALFIVHYSLLINVFAQSPYALRTGRELVIFGVGAATGVSALVLENGLISLTEAQVINLDRLGINRFDRGATNQFNPNADRLSDVTLAGNAALLGLLTIGTKPMRQDIQTVAVIYLETVLLANGIQRSIKNVSQRTRPFVYNPAAPLAEKLDRNARQSFFSGHTTNSFATAVFTGEVFRHYFPDSKLKPVVWVSSLGLATATAVLRYEAGRHYPTDLLAGAAFGSLVGWGIPKLHEVKNQRELGRRLDVQPWSNGQANGIYVRLAVFSR